MKRIVSGSEMKALDGYTINGCDGETFCGDVSKTADLMRLWRREQWR